MFVQKMRENNYEFIMTCKVKHILQPPISNAVLWMIPFTVYNDKSSPGPAK